jgi:hypothetical protein
MVYGNILFVINIPILLDNKKFNANLKMVTINQVRIARIQSPGIDKKEASGYLY